MKEGGENFFEVLTPEQLTDVKNTFEFMKKEGADFHFKSINPDELADWMIFKKFLDGKLELFELEEVEKQYRERRQVNEGVKEKDYENNSRMNFFGLIRNLMTAKSLSQQLEELKK